MKKLKISKGICLMALALIFFAPSCKKTQDVNLCWSEDGNGAGAFEPEPELDCTEGIYLNTLSLPTGGVINIQTLLNSIVDSFAQIPGFQISVAHNNTIVGSRSSGYARTLDECWPLVMNSCNKNNIASVTKILTAAATLMLLEDNGLDETEMIKDWLPPSWAVNSRTDSLTFRQLFSHNSGLLSRNSDLSNTLSYQGIKTCLETGVQDTLVGTQRYLNVNYALMRVIIPRLWQVRGDCPTEIKNITEVDATTANTYYEKAIQKLILEPAGVMDGTLDNHSDNSKKTLYYDVSNPGEGVDAGSWTSIAGGGGWYLSAEDLTLVMQRLFSNNYVSPGMLSKMGTMVMGFWNQPIAEDGRTYGHGGDVGDAVPMGRGYHSMLLHFQSGVSIAMNINSDISYTPSSTSRILVSAYDAARD